MGAGFDLTWHPELPQFAYLVKGPGEREHTLQIIGAGTEPASRSAVIPGFAAVRYPLWAKQQQEIMLIADPAAEPREIAYSLKHDRVYTETYRGRFKPFAPGNHPLIPTWVARPWNPAAELPVWEVSQHLSYPNPGGSAYYFGPVPVGERRALVWSPRATVAAAAAWQGNEVMVTVLRPAWDARENEPIYRLQGRHIAIYDDGITTFTAGGNSVTAINHLTGEKADWTVPGEILGLQLTRDTLFIVQSGRVGRVLLREPVQVK